MTERFTNPVIKYTTATLKTMPGAQLIFFVSGTTTPKVVYQDFEATIPHGSTVTALSDGHFPPIFLNGAYRVELKYLGVMQPGWPVDNVGATNAPAPLDNWNSQFSYSEGQLVTGADGNRYQSLQGNNLNNEPSASPLYWSQIFLGGNVDTWEQLDTAARSGAVPKSDAESAIRYSLDLPAPTVNSYPKGNPDGTYTNRTFSEVKEDLGAVSGPPSSLSDQVALFDGVTGKLLKAGNTISAYLSGFLTTIYGFFPQMAPNFAALASATTSLGRIINIPCHTSGSIGGGEFVAVPSSGLTPDGGTISVSATSGIYWKRSSVTSILTDYFGISGLASDNLPKLNFAAAAAVSYGLPLVGRKDEYFGVSGNFVLPDNLKIQDLKLRQLTPSSGVRTIFKNSGAGNIVIKDCAVDRNGKADATDTQSATDAAGVWLTGFPNLLVDGLEVFGDGKGIGFLTGAISGSLIMRRLYLHDMTYYHPTAPATEYLSAMTVLDQSVFDIDTFKIMNIYSKTGTDPVRRFQTDGLGVGGQAGAGRFSIRNGFISNVGEGIDITGSGGSFDFDITNVRAEDCGFTGFKMANGNNTGRVINCSSVRSGWTGIAIVGAGADVSQLVGNFIVDGCFIYDTGLNPEISGGSITYDGIQIGQASTQPKSPYNLIINNTLIIDRNATKTMDYGVRAYDAVTESQNVLVGENVIIQGFKVKDVASRGAINTFGRYMMASMGTGAGYTSASGVWTDMVFNQANYDENALYSAGIFTAKYAGEWQIQCSLVYSFNATGLRGVRLVVNGVVVSSDLRSAITVASEATPVSSIYSMPLAAGDVVKVQYYQTSGTGINFSTTGTFARFRMMKFGG